MCGIAGIINLNNDGIDESALRSMSGAIHSRGPDDEGFYIDTSAGLAHRRLSIIDLSTGHQPMVSQNNRYVIVFNGEIYNFKEIKHDLMQRNVHFKSHSDTEVLLELFAADGPACLDRLNGMFAFAIWDKTEKTLFLARDRMGKKPLYYGLINNHFVFASELKALVKFPQLKPALSKRALKHYLVYEYVPAPLSILEGVSKLKQAYYLKLEKGQVLTQRYWNQKFAPVSDLSEAEAGKRLRDLLLQSIEYRMIADVPVGVFLSGGLDSSSVVALLSEVRETKNIKTFSINFEEQSFDESLYSSTVAKKFGTDHHEETLTASIMLDILPNVTRYMDEPFADYSILPTYLLSRFTSKHVKVALGGDGADELFCGYPTFFAGRLAETYSKMPGFVRSLVSGTTRLLPASDKDMSLDFKARQFLLGAAHEDVIRNQVWLSGFSPEDEARILSKNVADELAPVDPYQLILDEMKLCDSDRLGDRMLYFYQKFYMCDDILVKVDRASMAHSLEVRAPFLDVNVVNFVNSLPYEYKLKGVTTKYLLKKVMNRQLPAMITQRSKKGFGVPIAPWLKKDLKPLLLETLSETRIKNDGLFNYTAVQELIAQHVDGKRNNRKQLFTLLMLHFWMDQYLK